MAEPEERNFFVTHTERIRVTQLVTARTKKEAVRKARYGEDRHSKWLDWRPIAEPTGYLAFPVRPPEEDEGG